MKIKSKELAELIATSVLMDIDICPTFPIRFRIPGRLPRPRTGWPWPDPPKPYRERLEMLFYLHGSDATRIASGLVAGLIVDHVYEASQAIQYMDKNEGLQASNRLSEDIISITGECGNQPIHDIIRRLMKKFGIKFPPLPDPEPVYLKGKFSKIDQLQIHSVISFAISELDNNAATAISNSSFNQIESLLG